MSEYETYPQSREASDPRPGSDAGQPRGPVGEPDGHTAREPVERPTDGSDPGPEPDPTSGRADPATGHGTGREPDLPGYPSPPVPSAHQQVGGYGPGQPGHPGYGPPGPGPDAPGHPGYGQPAWPPVGGSGGTRGGGGRGPLAVLGVLVLMVIAALGGGVAGAAFYAQTQSTFGGAGGQRVVDAPQLDYTSLASIASDVGPSVVSVRVGQFGGSGVVMSEDGHIITNAHVVSAARDGRVEVKFSDGTIAQGTVVGADPRSDIAVIRARGVDDLDPATFGDSDEVLVGDTVLAIGSPLGYEGSVTQGIISAMDRTLEPGQPGAPSLSGLLQIDAAINRGNSGGALVNLAGEVVGINTAIAVESRDDGFLGVGFAIPSDRATDVARTLIAGEEVQHAYLGVRVSPAEGGGAVIGGVDAGSPADEAGLREGDVVLRLGDRRITDANDLVSAVQSRSPGDTLELEFRRDGETRSTQVTLGNASAA